MLEVRFLGFYGWWASGPFEWTWDPVITWGNLWWQGGMETTTLEFAAGVQG